MPAPVRLSSFGAMTTAVSPNRIVVSARPAISRAALAATLASVALAGAGYSLARSLPAGHVSVAPTCSETCGPTPTTATEPPSRSDRALRMGPATRKPAEQHQGWPQPRLSSSPHQGKG
jgi:hypothetical protein